MWLNVYIGVSELNVYALSIGMQIADQKTAVLLYNRGIAKFFT